MSDLYQKVVQSWALPDRATELNRLVERLADEGVKLAEFDEALGRLWDEIRLANVDEETEDIVIDVSSRLHGWCHPDQRIKIRDELNVNGQHANGNIAHHASVE